MKKEHTERTSEATFTVASGGGVVTHSVNSASPADHDGDPGRKRNEGHHLPQGVKSILVPATTTTNSGTMTTTTKSNRSSRRRSSHRLIADEDAISLLTGADTLTASTGTLSSSAIRRQPNTAVIKPRSDSLRSGLERASANLTMNTLRINDRTLYGRDKELKLLQQAFSRTKTPTSLTTSLQRQLVLISGPAGVGKSALVGPLEHNVLREGGFFMTGKFDQQQQQQHQLSSTTSSTSTSSTDEPYSAITAACRVLVERLMAQETYRHWQFSFEELQSTLRRELNSIDNHQEEEDDDNNTTDRGGASQNANNATTSNNAGGGATEWAILTTVFPDMLQLLGGDYLHDDPGWQQPQDNNGPTNNKNRGRKKKRKNTTTIGYMEAKNSFNYAFRKFLRVLCRFGRVVLVLDDLQWADLASLDLIQLLITDVRGTSSPSSTTTTAAGQQQGLMIIGTYRSNEIHDTHPLQSILRELESTLEREPQLSFSVQDITVGNLELEHINKLLVDVLSSESVKTASLAEVVHRKTQGNIFYVKQFLKSLALDHADDTLPLLSFQMGTMKWTWDVQEIELRASVTQNVVEMIQQELQSMPPWIVKLLPIVACLGASFETSVFERVLRYFNDNVFSSSESCKANTSPAAAGETRETVDSSSFDPDDFLFVCQDHGLLVPDAQHTTIKWEHDKIQEAALSLADPDDLRDWQCKLGEFLMAELNQDELESSIFVLINLLDSDTSKLPKNNPRRLMLAELSHTAGVKAMKGAAFHSASRYLARGVELLPEGHWEMHYNLSLQLYSAAAEAHYCTGDIEETQALSKAVIEVPEAHGYTILDKERAWNVFVDSIASKGQSKLAEEKLVEILGLLGCHFPKLGLAFHTLGGVLHAEFNIAKTEEIIPKLPIMTDAAKQWSMRLLFKLTTFGYQNNSPIVPLAILKGLKYTLKYGVGEWSPPILTAVGLILAAALGDLKRGSRLGELALELFQQRGESEDMISGISKARTCFVASVTCLHWQRPISSIRKILWEGYGVGLRIGDVESALWSMMCYLEMGYIQGLPLSMLEKDYRIYTQQMAELKQEDALWSTRPVHQLILNMLGLSEDPSRLDGEALDLRKLNSFSDGSHIISKNHAKKIVIHNAFWNVSYSRTVEVIEESGAHEGFFDEVFAGSFHLPPLHFLCALACHVEFQKTRKRKHKKMAKYFSSRIQVGAKKGNPNVVHCAKILEAESASLKPKQFLHSLKLYKEAIMLAGRQGCSHIQALANERLGELYLRNDLKSDGKYHLLEASRLYYDWGHKKRAQTIRERNYGVLGQFLQKAEAPPSVDFVLATGS